MGERTRSRAGAVFVVTVAALAAGLLVTPATAAESCAYDAGTQAVTATIAAGGQATLVVVGEELHFGASPTACGLATVLNTDTITIAGEVGSAETLVLDHRGGIFGPGATAEFNTPEIEIATTLGDASDRVVVYATEGADVMAPGQNGMALNTDGDVDVTFSPGIFQLEAHMLGGNDYFNGRGQGGAGLHFLGPITLTGDDGDDTLLRGSSDPDAIDGGAGNDNLQGQEGERHHHGRPGERHHLGRQRERLALRRCRARQLQRLDRRRHALRPGRRSGHVAERRVRNRHGPCRHRCRSQHRGRGDRDRRRLAAATSAASAPAATTSAATTTPTTTSATPASGRM